MLCVMIIRNFKINYKDKVQEMEVKREESQNNGQSCWSQEESKTTGSWTFNQNLLYIVFLQKNKVVMQSKRKRRNERIFDKMSQFIGTRTSLQCRSHHQKFLEKLGDIKTIIHNFKKYVPKQEFKAKYLEAIEQRKGSTHSSEQNSHTLKIEQIEDADEGRPSEDRDEAREGELIEAEEAQEQQGEDRGKANTETGSGSGSRSGSDNDNAQSEQGQQSAPNLTTPQFYQMPFVIINNGSSFYPVYFQNMQQYF